MPRTVPAPAHQDRRAYLREICDLLWPAPATVTVSGAGPGRPGRPGRGGPGARAHAEAAPLHSEFIVLPSLGRPRLLVPPGSRPAAAAVRRYGEPGSRKARVATRALSIALASGLGGMMLRGRVRVHAPASADTIETYLRAGLARDIRVSMHLGEPRANRKPVLQLLSARGEPAGFAKIGVNPLTSGLVRAERDALGRLGRAGLRDVMVPRVLHYGEWHGLDVLVLSALPVWLRRRPLPWPQLAAAMGEIAAVDGLHDAPLAGGSYWQRLASRLAAADEDADRAALSGALGVLATRAGGTRLAFGAWHGDWTPWNMASTDHGLLVWDWERFTGDVPLGFDALHYWLQTAVVPVRGEPRAAAAECVDRAPRLLAPFGVGPPEARLTAIVYLADLATRYLADQQARAGARLGIPGDWLIPAITEAVALL
jgi:hypothetical protein